MLYQTALPQHVFLLMFIAGLAVHLHFIAKYGLLALPTSIVRLDATESALYITQKNGVRIKAVPQSSTYLSAKVVMLAWKPADSRLAGSLINRIKKLTPANLTIVMRDNTSSQEDFRRLRVLLKFGKLYNSNTA
ncbi:hypothetical protein [Alkalimarinus coralli]|uniref:hypothetical protein n=1 Tax=Alkalimarinus coralli TaxID=2935863 RepID=UPI00202B6DA2|nr:hypothetical protein [Alkalimarinus coralli]